MGLGSNCVRACCSRSVTKRQKMTAEFMKINRNKKSKEIKRLLREPGQDTKRVLPAEKRAMKEAE